MSESEILDLINSLYYGDRISRMCLTPRTTAELRESFEKWRSEILIYVGEGFTNHLKKLESGGVIQFTDKKWTLTEEGRKVVEKYIA